MTARKLLLAGALLLASSAASAQLLINCAPSTPCTSSGPENTGTGDAPFLAGYKINYNFQNLSAFFSPPFSKLAAGTNTTAAMVIGTGASLSTTGTGSIAATALASGASLSSPSISTATITGASIDSTTTMDALNVTDLQSSALVGQIPYALIPGSGVRYPNSTTVTIASSDNGNVVNNDYAGASSVTLPAINTSGITPNAFQVAIFNTGSGTMTITPTSPTTINLSTSLSVPSGTGAIIFADANTSGTGNYNYTAFPTGASSSGATLGANTFTGIQTISMSLPTIRLQDTGQGGTNQDDWVITTTQGTNPTLAITTASDGWTGGTNIFSVQRGASGTNGAVVLNETFGCITCNTTYTFNGGTATFAGNVKAPLLLINGSALGTTTNQSFIYQPASNQIGFGGVPSGTPTEYGYFNAAGNLVQLFDAYIQEASPRQIWFDTSQSSNTNLELSQISYASGALTIGSLTDTFGGGYSAFTATRGASGAGTGPAWINETFGCSACNTTYTFYGNATFNSQIKAADVVVNGSALPATGLSGLYNPVGTQLGFATNGIAAGYFDGSQNLDLYQVPVAIGVPPTVSCVSNCVAQNAGTGFTVTFTASSAVISGTALTWAINEPVVLTTTGTLPAAFTAGTSVTGGSFSNGTQYVITSVGTTNFTAIGASSNAVGTVFTATGAGSGTGTASTPVYFVNSTGIATTTFQLCSTPPTLSGETWTACTSLSAATAGTGTTTATGYGNYLQVGGAHRGQFQLPEGTYSGAPTYRLTFPSAFPNGILCTGVDETASAQLTQSGHTTTTCAFAKGTAASALDWLVWQAGAY